MVGETSGPPSSALDAPTDCYLIKPALHPSASSQSSQRLKQCSDDVAALGEEHLLVVSPYTSRRHLLPLNTIGKPQRLLAKAFTVLSPIRDDYATVPYPDAFNWDLVVSVLRSLVETEGYAWKHQLFYIVVFRSQVSPMTDRSHLAMLDERSHAEAMESGGLLKYWFGIPDINGRNMATCIWREREDAKQGSIGLRHKEAMRATTNMYSEWKLERLSLVIGDHVENWVIVDWE